MTTRGLLVLPPRRVRGIRRFNGAWLEHQIRRLIPIPEQAIFWIRYASPELVDRLARLNPLVCVYECSDALHFTPGLEIPPWDRIFEAAERELTSYADALVVPHAGLGARYAAWGANVRVIAHGVDLHPLGVRPRLAPSPVVVGFVGTLDRRVDEAIVRAVATAEPGWRVRLVGPVAEGFDARAFDDLANVSVEPPVPHEQLGEVLSTFDLGFMPYFDHPMYLGMSPLKNLELLAAGIPAVARPSPALEPFRDLVTMATSPEEFVDALRRALQDDNVDAVRARRRRAEDQTWDVNHRQMLDLLSELIVAKQAQ
ncbi:MAG: glycosyltransferase [Solirubrobacteraceae bacterium]